MDRTQLFDTLSNLPPTAFERLLIAVNMPRMNRAGAAATIGEQVSALLIWAESPIGPGVEAIARHLSELHHVEFDAYLRSLIATYEKWWEHYTLTDVEGKVNPLKPENPSVFDFGLMVQTAVKATDDPDFDTRAEEREKTERLPVLEGIRKYADDHVLLVGRPGSGKSTALIRLLLEEATQTLQQSNGQVPVLVELRYWNVSIELLIQGFLQRHGLTLDGSNLSTLLGQGRFLLLIDGLNELPSEGARTQLSAFRRNHPKVPMIFTTRDLGLGGDLGIEKKLEMQPLTEAQMKAFIRAYVPDQAEAMLRQLNNRLREFGQTPLLLWMLCEVFQQSPQRQLPTNLAEVFRAFTTMYEDSSVRKHEVALLKGDVRPLSDRRLWKEALKALAALMMQGEASVDFRVAIHRTEVERELRKLFANEKFPARDILDDLLKYHLLQNRTTDQLEFRHQLIQEYYAAEYLLRLLPDLTDEQLKRDYLNLLKWTEPIVLMLALVDEETQALRVVKLAIDNVDLMLGARLAGAVKLNFQSTALKHINDLGVPQSLRCQCWAISRSTQAIKDLLVTLHDSDSCVRSDAIKALGHIGSDQATEGLLSALHDSDSRVRSDAIEALGRIGSDRATEGLLSALHDSDSHIRSGAIEALGRIGSDRAIEGLLSALQDRDALVGFRAAAALVQISSKSVTEGLLSLLHASDVDVRLCVIRALGSIGTGRAIEGLVRALHDTHNLCRGYAAEALVSIGSNAAAGALLGAATHRDPNPRVRTSIVVALEKIGGEKGIEGLLGVYQDTDTGVRKRVVQALASIGSVATVEGLLSALHDPDIGVCESAAEALVTIGNGAVEGLLRVLHDKNAEVRRIAAETLGKIGSKRAAEGLLHVLHDEDFYVCKSTAEALVSIGEDAVEQLLKVLYDSNPKVRRLAAMGLGKIGNKAAIRGLLSAIHDSDLYVRKTAIPVLGQIGDEFAVESLLAALHDPNSEIRWIATSTLRSISTERAVNGLLSALYDTDAFVRWSAADALGKIGSDAAIAGLLKALEDIDPEIRKRAAEALATINDERASKGLINALLDPEPFVRRKAVEALGHIGHEDAIESLLNTLHDSDTEVRRKAVEALGHIGHEATVEGLLNALYDPDTKVCEKAAEALGKIGGTSAVMGLLNALNSTSIALRRNAATALGHTSSEGAITGLLNALHDPDAGVRCKAAEALGCIGSKNAVKDLVAILHDIDLNVGQAAVVALKEIGSEEAVEGLLSALRNRDTQVRMSAIEALKKIGSNRAVQGLLSALRNRDTQVRMSAIEALVSIGSTDVIKGLTYSLYDKGFKDRWRAAKALETIGNSLPLVHLWQLYRQQPNPYLWQAISAIQNSCQFYNHEIFHSITSQGKTISLYFSYALADEALQTQLAKHLTLLGRQGVITSWISHQILPGEDRTQTIHQQLNTADIILLLISAHSLADDTCYHLEIQRAIERHQAGEARVIPILLYPVDWQGAPFSQLSLLPKNHQPVTTWPNQDEAFKEIAEGIRQVAMEVRKEKCSE